MQLALSVQKVRGEQQAKTVRWVSKVRLVRKVCPVRLVHKEILVLSALREQMVRRVQSVRSVR